MCLIPLSKGDKFGKLRFVLETKGLVSIRAAESEPWRGGQKCPQGIQLGEGPKRLPGVVRRVIVWCSPFDKKEQARSLGTSCAVRVHSNFDIKDGVNLVGVAIDKILGGGNWLIKEGSVGELVVGVVRPGEEFADMENWVDTGEGGGEGEFDGDGGDDGGNGERAEKTRAEFGGWVFKESNVAGGQADTVPNFEGRRAAMSVGGGGLLSLREGKFTGDGELDIPNGVKVGGRQGGGGGRDSQGGWGGGVETVIGQEGGLVGGGVSGVVVGEFSNRQPCDPIRMLRLHVGAQYLFNGPVGAFRLPICLRVVSRGQIQCGAKAFEKGLPKVRGDAGVAVGDNDVGQTPFGKDVLDENMGQLLRGDGFVDRDKNGHLG